MLVDLVEARPSSAAVHRAVLSNHAIVGVTRTPIPGAHSPLTSPNNVLNWDGALTASRSRSLVQKGRRSILRWGWCAELLTSRYTSHWWRELFNVTRQNVGALTFGCQLLLMREGGILLLQPLHPRWAELLTHKNQLTQPALCQPSLPKQPHGVDDARNKNHAFLHGAPTLSQLRKKLDRLHHWFARRSSAQHEPEHAKNQLESTDQPILNLLIAGHHCQLILPSTRTRRGRFPYWKQAVQLALHHHFHKFVDFTRPAQHMLKGK